jgi:hypothetical protein
MPARIEAVRLQSSADQDKGIKPGGTRVLHLTSPSLVFHLDSSAAPIASSSAGGITTTPSLRNQTNPTVWPSRRNAVSHSGFHGGACDQDRASTAQVASGR